MLGVAVLIVGVVPVILNEFRRIVFLSRTEVSGNQSNVMNLSGLRLN